MNINEQLEKILANLGVEMEYAEHERYDENSVPEVSIFQSSRDHYGVFYRLDIIDQLPQLRIMVPVENGALKAEMYLRRSTSGRPRRRQAHLNSLLSLGVFVKQFPRT